MADRCWTPRPTEKYIVCNADEGDSGTFADRMIMEGDPFVLIEGMTIAGLAVGATQGYVYLRSEYPHAIAALNDGHRDGRRATGYLGADVLGSGLRFDMDVRVGAGAYICGEETSLLESLEGKRGDGARQAAAAGDRGPVRQADRRQQRAHRWPPCRRSWPTAAQRYARLRHGPLARHAAVPARRQRQARRPGRKGLRRHAARAARRLRRRHGQRPAGARRPGRRPAGRLPAAVAVRHCRWTTRRSPAGRRPVGHGGIVVFDDTVDMAKQARFAMEFCAIESCGKCTPCRIGSVRGVEVIDRIIAGEDAPTPTSRC